MDSQLMGWRSDCAERFERGETVAILCKADNFLYRIIARKRGMAKGPVK